MRKIVAYCVWGLLLGSVMSFSQGKMRMSTSKPIYAYGDTIEIRMRIWNDTPVAFTFYLAGGHDPYWLLDSVVFGYAFAFFDRSFIFNPGDSRTWVWRISPSEFGLPNMEGVHLLTGLCGRFEDTVTFQAPMFRGGPMGVHFKPTVLPADIARIRDSLNATVIWSFLDSTGISERWHVEGLQVDSLASALSADPRVSETWVSRPFPLPSAFIVTGVPDEAPLPGFATLRQNYPNPFNPKTRITFDLPSSAEVKLQVYDIAGRLVSTLMSGWTSAGTHFIDFDASNLASGVYYYQLESKSGRTSRQMILLR